MSERARVFIAGCGFVGVATARLLHARGYEVIGGTQSAESAAALKDEPFEVIACDIANPDALATEAKLQDVNAAIHCASSGRGGADAYREIYLRGVQNLASVLRPRHLIFTSSTSVYAQTDGSIVTEESAAEPQRETGRILRDAENVVLSSGGGVARLAGIYGPGRSVLLRRFFSAEAIIEESGSRMINQVHRDDAATALAMLLEKSARGIFNVVDDEPITQLELYTWLARRFQRPLPPRGPIDPHRKRGWTNKRVSNTKLRALGWKPQYPAFRTAIEMDPELLADLI